MFGCYVFGVQIPVDKVFGSPGIVHYLGPGVLFHDPKRDPRNMPNMPLKLKLFLPSETWRGLGLGPCSSEKTGEKIGRNLWATLFYLFWEHKKIPGGGFIFFIWGRFPI